MLDIQKDEYLDVYNFTLEEWLNLVFNPPKGKFFERYTFPTDEHRDKYIDNIDKYSEKEVLQLIEVFLMKSGSFNYKDRMSFEILCTLSKSKKKDDIEMYKRMSERQFFKRLLYHFAGAKNVFPWEGITWILDLLPHNPQKAIDTIDNYLCAHIQLLPDSRITGLFDAIEIIKAKFIGLPQNRGEVANYLLDLNPRDFEYLIEKLFVEMGYETEVTPEKRDGGRDIIATKINFGEKEKLFIECKRYTKRISVTKVRQLLGVVSSKKVNKGILVSTNKFTKPSVEFSKDNPRIELINGDELVVLLNKYLGAKWFLHLERIIFERKNG